MPIIYIHNLKHKETAACRVLFNAAAQTEEGIKTKKFGIQMTADMPGLWAPLEDFEIEQEITMALNQRSGRVREIGYLRVNLILKSDSLEVTEYEKIYGLSAKAILESAGFICSDEPINAPSKGIPLASANAYSSFFKKTTGNSSATRTKKNIEDDKRFKKSSEDGILFKGESFSFISDDELKTYGATQWRREKDGMDNIVFILEMDNHNPNLTL
ncbi:hypothetical protein [Legionella sainthelensi]|uniref:hypothetical protein n=1 Tax=Legionella sainthelensi TaxID=28087 RepID=UPI000E2059E0|nr:hypothetical protein [Legionella sainthelensi]